MNATQHDSLNRPVQVTLDAFADMTVTEYTYNLFGVITQTTGTGLASDGTAVTTTLMYDRLGRVVEEQSSPKERVRHVYDAAGNEVSISVDHKRAYGDGSLETPWLSNVTLYAYDPLNRRISQAQVDEFHNGTGLLQTAWTSFAFDPLGRVVSKTDANRAGTPSADDPRLRNPDDPTFAIRFWTEQDLGPAGVLLNTFLPSRSGRRVDYQYDVLGQLVLEQWVTTRTGQPDAEVGRLAYVYDAQGRLLESQQLTLNVGPGVAAIAGGEPFTSYPSAAWGVLDWGASYPDPNYGLLGSDHGLIVPAVAWNPGALKDRGAIHTYDYDGLGRVVLEVTNDGTHARSEAPAGAGVHSRFDAAGRRLQVEGPNESWQTYAYDGANRVQQMQYGMGASGTYAVADTYHAVAGTVYLPSVSGLVTSDRLEEMTYTQPAGGAQMVVSNTYDSADRLKVREAQWIVGSTAVTPSLSKLEYQYDAASRIKEEKRTGKEGPGGWFSAPQAAEVGGQERRQNLPFKLDAVRSFSYDAAGAVLDITLKEKVRVELAGTFAEVFAVETNAFNDQKSTTSGPVFDSVEEANAPGNRDRKQQVDLHDPIATGVVGDTKTFSTGAVEGSQEYLYDAEGNLIVSLMRNADGRAVERWLYSYDHRNRLVHATFQQYGWTISGDVTFETRVEVFYRYNAEDQLIQRSEVWKSDFAADVELGLDYATSAVDEYGNKLTPFAGGDPPSAWPVRDLHFLQDGATVFGYRQDGGIFVRLVWGPGVDQPVARQATAGLGTHWYVTDPQGSVLGLVDAATGEWAKVVTYNEAGVDRRWAPAPVGPNAFHDEFEYTGRYTDYLTKLQYNRARWYNPGAKQFMSKDPIGFAGGDSNVYRYVHNSFPNATDPSGMDPGDPPSRAAMLQAKEQAGSVPQQPRIIVVPVHPTEADSSGQVLYRVQLKDGDDAKWQTIQDVDVGGGVRTRQLILSQVQDNPAYARYWQQQNQEFVRRFGYLHPTSLDVSFLAAARYLRLRQDFVEFRREQAPAARTELPTYVGEYGTTMAVHEILEMRAIMEETNRSQVFKDDVLPWIPVAGTANSLEEGIWALEHGDPDGASVNFIMAGFGFAGDATLAASLLGKLSTSGGGRAASRTGWHARNIQPTDSAHPINLADLTVHERAVIDEMLRTARMSHTRTSTEVFEALRSGQISYQLRDLVPDLVQAGLRPERIAELVGREGGTAGGSLRLGVFELNPRLSADQLVLNAYHEGLHTLDIVSGRIPRNMQATAIQQLYGELRATVGTAEFANRNNIQYLYRGMSVSGTAAEVHTRYGMPAIANADFYRIVTQVQSEFPTIPLGRLP